MKARSAAYRLGSTSIAITQDMFHRCAIVRIEISHEGEIIQNLQNVVAQ